MSAVNKYEVVGTLGTGGFASVIAIKDVKGTTYALKKPFHDSKFLGTSTGVINMKELYIMAWIKHPYIQNACTVFFEDPCPNDNVFLPATHGYDRMFFLMTRADYTCHELVHQFRAHISHVKRAMFQAACALHHLHSEGICHRDVKPGNLLCYYKEGVLTVKLTDFGMTKPMNYVNRHSLHAGTAYYRAPELILKNMDYGFSMDIWSLGCTFFEMVSRKALFKASTDIDLLQLIFKNRGSPSATTFRKMSSPEVRVMPGVHKAKSIRSLLNLSPNDKHLFDQPVVDNLHNPGMLAQFCDLLENMVKVNPDERLTMDQVLRHPFFSEFFIPHPLDYGLWRPSAKDMDPKYRYRSHISLIQEFPGNHPLWNVGANCFIELAPNPAKYDNELLYTIRFHGLDIYSRYLNKIEPMKDPEMYRYIAWCSGYIISKYFLDEASDHLWDIFPESYTEISAQEILKIEKLILQVLEFEIYRPTCFTYLEHRAFYGALFALMLKGELMFNRPIRVIMDIFNKGISDIMQVYPNGKVFME